jgi:CRISPR/Cas system-associated exonuclease Cas4 (RecB family)
VPIVRVKIDPAHYPAEIERLATATAAPSGQRDLVEAVYQQVAPGDRRRYVPAVSRAGQCPRALTYWACGIPETNPTPPRLGLTWKVGDAVEAILDDALRATGVPITNYQKKIRIPYAYGDIFGQMDRIIEPDTVLDYKSINTYGFQEVERAASPEHVAQVNLYIHALRLEGQTRFKRGCLLYMDKSSSALAQQWFDYSPELAEAAIAMFEAVEEAARAGQLLPRPAGFTPTQAPCSYCNWRAACWEVGGPAADKAEITEVADLTSLEGDLRWYLLLASQASEVERAMDEVKAKVRAALVDIRASRGIGGGVLAEISRQVRTTINREKVPPLFAAAASEEQVVETLRIRKIREKEGADNGNSARRAHNGSQG